MIETSLSRVKINEVVQSQVPEFIDADNPNFGNFLKQYYLSQEFQGGPVDIAENLVDYKSLDFLNNRNLIGFTSLSQYITGGDDTIYVDSTNGWPTSYGLLKIDDEIITYTGKRRNLTNIGINNGNIDVEYDTIISGITTTNISVNAVSYTHLTLPTKLTV